MKTLTLSILILCVWFCGTAQENSPKDLYREAYSELRAMLEGEVPLSFKRAVFLTENTYLENTLSEEQFEKTIRYYVRLARNVQEADGLVYREADRDEVLKAASIFRAMKDTLTIGEPSDPRSYTKYPLTYDLHDFWGEKDWTQMFVTKLLATGSGNCHSLPAFYKIVADELQVKTWLSIAPNHT